MNKVYVAKLGKAVGLQGHLRLFIDSDFPMQFKKGAVFTTNRNLTLTISELFTTQEATKEFCVLKENEFFWFDLISCEIFENELLLGKVKDIHRYPLNDYLEVQTSSELVSKELPKVFLIPHIFDKFIEKVDIENKKIFVKNAFDILENS